MQLAREPAVVLGDLRTSPTAARVAQEREVLAAREPARFVEHRELAELDEVIAAPARAELCPGAILQSGGHARDAPVGVHHVVLTPRLERGAHPEPCLTLDRPRQTCLVIRQRADGQIQHRQLHPARDVDSHRIRDDGVMRRQHTADGQSVAHVRIRHERARYRDRQTARILHLLHGGRLVILAPDLVGSVALPRGERVSSRRVIDKLPRKSRIAGIVEKCRGRRGDAPEVTQDGRHAALCRVSFLQNLFGSLSAAACWNPHLDQIFCFHDTHLMTAHTTFNSIQFNHRRSYSALSRRPSSDLQLRHAELLRDAGGSG